MKKNFLFNILNSVITYGFSLISIMYVSRILHPEFMGRVNFSLSIISYFLLLAGMGLPLYGMRKCASVRDNKILLSETVKELLYISLLFSILSAVLLYVICCINPRLNQEKSALFILSSQLFFQAIGCEWFYKAMEQFKQISIRDMVIKCLTLILILLFVKSPAQHITYIILLTISSALTYLYNFIKLSAFIDFCVPIKLATLKKHLKPILVFFIMSCATQIYVNIDLVMLGFMEPNTIVGGYSIVEKIKALLTITGGLLWTVCLPKATEYWNKKETTHFEMLAMHSMDIVLFIQIPVMILTLLLAKPMLRFIAGSDYLFAVNALIIISFSILPIAVSNIIGGQILIPAQLEKKLLAAELIGAFLNIVLNFLTIPIWNMNGAAAATVLSEFAVTIITVIAVKRDLKLHIFNWWEYLVELVFATIAGSVTQICCSIFEQQIHYFLAAVIKTALFISIYLIMLLLSRNKTLQFVYLRTMEPLITKILRRKYYIKSYENIDWSSFTSASLDSSRAPKSHGYICPCCEKEFSDFLSGSFHLQHDRYKAALYNPKGRHVICPECGSFSRHRLLTHYLDTHKDIIQNKHFILYFAKEASVERWFNRNHIKYVSADLYTPADLKINIEETGLPSASVDLIICNHVLEHVYDFKKALKEIYRIMTDDGLFICSFPILDSLPTYIEDLSSIPTQERIERFGQNDHLRIFGNDSLEIIKDAGFYVSTITGENAPEIICPLDGPADYDKTLLFACKKK